VAQVVGEHDEDEHGTAKRIRQKLMAVINRRSRPSAGTWRKTGRVPEHPDLRGRVPRHRDIKVRAYDRTGKPVEIQASGFMARVIQHETDHLDGVLLSTG